MATPAEPVFSLKALREKALAGVKLTLDELRFYIRSTRKSYTAAVLAAGASKGKKKTMSDLPDIEGANAAVKERKTAKPPAPPLSSIDFF